MVNGEFASLFSTLKEPKVMYNGLPLTPSLRHPYLPIRGRVIELIRILWTSMYACLVSFRRVIIY